MAKIGLKHFRYGILTEGVGGATYGAAKTPAKAISCNVSVNNNDASLYADDALAESDTSFNNADVTMGIDNDDLETMADLLGHTYSAEDGIVRSADDTAPYVGFGRIVTRMTNGVYNYKVEFIKKVKFSEPSQDDTTKGENVEFGTTEIAGKASALADGTWSVAKVFDNEADAISYLEGLFGTAPTTYTVYYNANGGTGNFDVDHETVTAGEAIATLPDGTGVTPPEGKEFAGWAKTTTATSATVTEPFTPTDDTTLYAVWVVTE